jgi:hypothetical protein
MVKRSDGWTGGGGCHANGGKEEKDQEGRQNVHEETFTDFRAQKKSHMLKCMQGSIDFVLMDKAS